VYPVCNSPKSMFKLVEDSDPVAEADPTAFASDNAENCSALEIRITEKNELPAALKRLFAHDGLAMLEVMTDSEFI
jgi:thiamine pyrophosphate-dependent acetolactate synthase large subunit-like protein